MADEGQAHTETQKDGYPGTGYELRGDQERNKTEHSTPQQRTKGPRPYRESRDETRETKE